jgi:acyl transferase domain-containing protein
MKSASDELDIRVPEPIAVVGIGCRFPGGVRDLASLGELLNVGADVISQVPADRWAREFHDPQPGEPGTTRSHAGAFMDEIDRFDATYFGIAPREAVSLDPQQRVLLEVAWEAMSDAGRPRDAWRGSRTAVFVGMLAGDYGTLHTKTLGVTGIGPHYASGIEFSFAAGRLAYAFDLHGPVTTLSSACSSSLLAVHLAAQSLRSGECDTAIAGGVNLLVTPELSIFMSRIGALSPSGSCRPFDIAADGVVRGEGCGVVVLRRLADALADGDRVHAVVLGSAVNHDGFSMGLTVPNASAQAAVVRSALEQAGIGPRCSARPAPGVTRC